MIGRTWGNTDEDSRINKYEELAVLKVTGADGENNPRVKIFFKKLAID